MIRVVYIHHLSGEHDLLKYLEDNFSVKKVFATDSGEMLYQGRSLPSNFFDHHADVVATTLPTKLHKELASSIPHIPTVGLHGYSGIFSGGNQREIWQSHAKNKGIKIPLSITHDPESPRSMYEIRNRVFLPSVVHKPGDSFGINTIKTFPELQEQLSDSASKAHIERYIKGDHVYIMSIKDFRDDDIYTTPILHKTDHGYKVCSHIKHEQKEDAIRYVRELHAELGLGPVAQFEFVINNHDLYLVHIDPEPKHTDNSALHTGLESVGSSMKDLWKNIVENAKRGNK
jgi:hypothetical protein